MLDEIKMIVGIEKIDDSEILYNTDNELANEVTWTNVEIITLWVMKDYDISHPQKFLEEALVA